MVFFAGHAYCSRPWLVIWKPKYLADPRESTTFFTVGGQRSIQGGGPSRQVLSRISQFSFLCLLFTLVFAPAGADAGRGKSKKTQRNSANAKRQKAKKQKARRTKAGIKNSTLGKRIVDVERIRAPRNLADAGKVLLQRSVKTSEAMLAHPRLGKSYERVIRAAMWVASEEGQLVNENLADLLNKIDKDFTTATSTQLERLLRTQEIFVEGFQDSELAGEETGPPSDVEEKALEDSATQMDLVIKKHLQPNFDARALFEDAARNVGAKNHKPQYANWLMGTYRLSETELPRATQVLDLMKTLSTSGLNVYLNQYRKDVEATLAGFSHPEQKRLFGNTLQRAFHDSGIDPSSKVPLSVFQNQIFRRYKKEIFSRILPYREIISVRNSVVDSELSRLDLSDKDLGLLRRYLHSFFLRRYRTYLPPEVEPVSKQTLAGHQLFVLAQRSNALIKLRETIRLTEEAKGKPKTSKPPVSSSLTRAERIAAYQKEQEEKKNRDLQTEIESGAEKTRVAKPIESRVAQNKEKIEAQSVDRFEKFVAVRSANASVASSLVDMYESLPDDSRLNVTKAFAELFDGENRRMSTLEAGTVSKANGFDVFYLRVHGKSPIRVYFLIDPEDGPVITGSQEKKGSERQILEIRKAEKAGRAYLKRSG